MPSSYRMVGGDALELLRTFGSHKADAIVTDPPAGISIMEKEWDHDKGGRDSWIAWLAEIMAETRRIAKPGAFALVWSLPRTSHWTATALEDAGWEVRDSLHHIFGTGFPKSKSQLKPAHEVWWLVKAPGSLAPLNIDAVRVTFSSDADRAGAKPRGRTTSHQHPGTPGLGREENHDFASEQSSIGRWPSNVIFSHSPDCGEGGACAEDCPVAELDRQSGVSKSGRNMQSDGRSQQGSVAFRHTRSFGRRDPSNSYEDEGGASRFFPVFRYAGKASRIERNAGLLGERNDHPTVKSVALMRWLVRLVAEPGEVVLDPFAGTGTTGIACLHEGVRFFGIDSDPHNVELANARLAFCRDEIDGDYDDVS